MKKILHYPIVLLFFGTIAIFTLLNGILPTKAFSEAENRYLAQPPKWTLAGMIDSGKDGFAQKFERYANDQFTARDGWISLKSRCERLLGKQENNGIVFGANDYLFAKYRSFDAAQLEKNTKLVSDFIEKFPQLHHYPMLVPSADNILTDFVPYGLGNVDQIAEIQKVYDRLPATAVVDVVSALQQHKNDEIYYRTDHHWTTLGAYFGYQALMQTVGREAVSPDPNQRETVEGFLGTYYNKAKNHDVRPDTITWYNTPFDRLTVDGEAKTSLYDRTQLDKRDKYAMFLHGNPGVTIIENDAAPAGVALVLKDSYANCLVPFLTQSYQKLVVVDLRSMPKGLAELIEQEQIEDVVYLYSFTNFVADTNFPRLKY